MKKAKLIDLIIRIYGVYPPESFSYNDLIRLRTMLVKYGKPKRSYLQAKGKAITETPVFEPPSFKPFKVEEDETEQSTNTLSYLDFPVSDEDGCVSPITNRRRIISDATTPIKRKRNE